MKYVFMEVTFLSGHQIYIKYNKALCEIEYSVPERNRIIILFHSKT
jgi:hypothetical protein